MKRSIGIAALVLAGSTLASPALAGKADNSVRFAAIFTPANVDPYYNNLSTIGGMIADHIWDTLIYRDPASGEYRGNLATAWRWVDDRTFELDLRQGVRFHNGAEFDADDVVYTFNFVSNPENKAVNLDVRWIERVEKIDGYKVRIHARQPFPAAPAFLASPRLAIHPHEYYNDVGPAGVNLRPVGTGPYQVVEHSRGKYLRLERNPDYFRDSPKTQPKIDKVEIRFIPDVQIQVAETVAGGLDLITEISPDQAAQLKEIQSLQIKAGEALRYNFLMINTLARTPSPGLRDLRVRQAIMYAIDRESIVKFLIGQSSRVIHTECHPIQSGCTDEGVRRYEYDPVRSRRLLAEAGYKDGFDVDFYAFRERNPTEAIIGYLNAVGIRARLRYMQATAVLSARQAGRVPLLHTSWGNAIDDLSNAVSRYHEFSLDDMNRDPEVRDLLLRADTSPNPVTRKELYAAAFKLIADRAYVLPLYSPPTHYAAAADLVFKTYSDEMPRFYEMSWK